MLDIPQKTSINLLLVLNGTGIVARLIPNMAAQRWTGPFNLIIIYLIANAVVLFAWIAVDSLVALWVWAVVYGCTAAGIHALFPVCLTSLTNDPKKFGARNGMGFATVGFAVLTGPPIAGALVERAGGSYVGLQCFAAGTMVCAACFATGARWAQVGWKVFVKI
jgi:predicted MFS family arabinose efflux permease